MILCLSVRRQMQKVKPYVNSLKLSPQKQDAKFLLKTLAFSIIISKWISKFDSAGHKFDMHYLGHSIKEQIFLKITTKYYKKITSFIESETKLLRFTFKFKNKSLKLGVLLPCLAWFKKLNY